MAQRRRDIIVAEVAETVLGLKTIETRHSDSLDFPTISIWDLVKALERVYDIGVADGEHLAWCRSDDTPMGGFHGD